MTPAERILQELIFLYGEATAQETWRQMQTILHQYPASPASPPRQPRQATGLSESDAVLITYADQFNQPGETPLRTLDHFLRHYLPQELSTLHLLPFFPYSSDDGFAVIDYRRVDPRVGDWDDVAALGRHYHLMFDAVINHVSSQSRWFQSFLKAEPPYKDYFITVDPAVDLSAVVRPRALPLLTPVDTAAGPRHVWTTFNTDQIDLNYANPAVLLEIVDLLLFYAARGASIIRLDAIAYLWKEIGTPCIHLPQTHAVVRLFRAVLDAVAPQVLLITETNVPHEQNISYFGRVQANTGQTDEAQLVYQFPLPPLTLHTFLSGNARKLSQWVEGLQAPGVFFNFIASHDGIGLMPARGLLTADEIQALVDQTLAHGGQVSYRQNPDGSRSVYELNITLYDILNDPRRPQPWLDVRRFLASQALMLSLAGVPGIYVHSLFGSRNCQECLQKSGQARAINRHKFDEGHLAAELEDPLHPAAQVFSAYRHLLRVRRGQPAFHPRGEQRVLWLEDSLFALLRQAPDARQTILCLVNVSGSNRAVEFNPVRHALPVATEWVDLIAGQKFYLMGNRLRIPMESYQARWLWARDATTPRAA